MGALIEGLRALPGGAQRVIAITVTAGVTLFAAAVLVSVGDISVWRIALIACGLIAGEAAQVVLPHGRRSAVRFTFGDTAVITGLLLASPGDLVIGMAVGVLVWQLVDRTQPAKLLFNLAQYAAAGSLAALVLGGFPTDPTVAGLVTVLGLVLAVSIFLAVNTLAVGAIVAAVAEDALLPVVRRMLPTNAIVTGCNAALALLLVVVWDQNPWVLPALAAPLFLVYMASRLRVAAQLDRERSETALSIERKLGDAGSADRIAALLVEGVGSLVGLDAAVWLEDSWRTPVPPGSAACPVDPQETDISWDAGSTFGPAIDGAACVAVGFGDGVLVAWEDGTEPTGDMAPWLERLARSATVHLARSRAAAALEQERATLRAVVDGTADGIFVLDERDTVALWNPAMGRLSGLYDSAPGRPVHDVLGEGPWTEEGVHDVLRATEDADDPRVWRVAVAAVREDQSSVLLRVAVVHDVTEERRVARMKDDMLAVVSHELRTPLTPIKASAQLLLRRADRLDTAQRERLLSEIEQRADHLARLVEDLLLVAQLSSHTGSRPRVVPATADLTEVVSREVERARESYPNHRITLDGPEQLIGTTDSLRLRQTVANLLDNACKYSPEQTDVHVRLSESGEHAVLEISDAGRGIAPEDRERIFERFERVDDPLHMTTSGAGLGLFIVRALTRALGGDIAVGGALGEGTRVTLRLPLLGVLESPVWEDRPVLRG